MGDARWLDVEERLQSAVGHFSKADEIFRKGKFDSPEDGYEARMAFMHAMQWAYTSLESGLLKILDILGEARPTGEEWHADLLRRAARPIENERPAILPGATFEFADEVRRFRHIAARSYDNFRPQEAGNAVAAARGLAARLMADLKAFRDVIDPAGGEG